MLNIQIEKSRFDRNYFASITLQSGDVLTLSTCWDDERLGGWQFLSSVNKEGRQDFDIKLPADGPYSKLCLAAERLEAKATLAEIQEIANFLAKHKLDTKPNSPAASPVSAQAKAW